MKFSSLSVFVQKKKKSSKNNKNLAWANDREKPTETTGHTFLQLQLRTNGRTPPFATGFTQEVELSTMATVLLTRTSVSSSFERKKADSHPFLLLSIDRKKQNTG